MELFRLSSHAFVCIVFKTGRKIDGCCTGSSCRQVTPWGRIAENEFLKANINCSLEITNDRYAVCAVCWCFGRFRNIYLNWTQYWVLGNRHSIHLMSNDWTHVYPLRVSNRSRTSALQMEMAGDGENAKRPVCVVAYADKLFYWFYFRCLSLTLKKWLRFYIPLRSAVRWSRPRTAPESIAAASPHIVCSHCVHPSQSFCLQNFLFILWIFRFCWFHFFFSTRVICCCFSAWVGALSTLEILRVWIVVHVWWIHFILRHGRRYTLLLSS